MDELTALRVQLNDALLQSGHVSRGDTLFNPSFTVIGERRLAFTLRKVSGSDASERTQVIFEAEIDENFQLLWISEVQELSHVKGFLVRDLKFGTAGNQTYATWNTGHPKPSISQNEVLISSYPDLLAASVVGWIGRKRIEKNWGFFEEDDVLHCVYSLFPLVRLFSVDKLGNGKMKFETLLKNKKYGSFGGMISIGSQPIRVKNYLLFTAHLKPQLLKFRVYLPLLAKVNLETSSLTFRFLRFPKSGLSLRRSKLNPFALAVNYASGLTPFGTGYLLGVGRADEDYKLFFLCKNDVSLN